MDLVQRAKAAAVRWIAAGTVRVLTSSRTTGRVPAGFSSYLRLLH